MGYDHGESFPFNFEQNVIPFGSKSKGKLSLQSHPIQCERKWKYSFLSLRPVSVVSEMNEPQEGEPHGELVLRRVHSNGI